MDIRYPFFGLLIILLILVVAYLGGLAGGVPTSTPDNAAGLVRLFFDKAVGLIPGIMLSSVILGLAGLVVFYARRLVPPKWVSGPDGRFRQNPWWHRSQPAAPKQQAEPRLSDRELLALAMMSRNDTMAPPIFSQAPDPDPSEGFDFDSWEF